MEKGDPRLKTFGSRVRQLRLGQGYSQEAFADQAQLDRSYMGRVERGETNITLLNIHRIADALKLPVADLFADRRRRGKK